VSEDAQSELIRGLLAPEVPEPSGLTPRERALLTYTDKLTLAPASIRATDIVPLRDAGLDDRGIHDACAIIAYFAFVNRIADGLGVELESP
jgi:uncharacterized peroxidase-related enzyme